MSLCGAFFKLGVVCSVVSALSAAAAGRYALFPNAGQQFQFAMFGGARSPMPCKFDLLIDDVRFE